jgi:hypothetical protein
MIMSNVKGNEKQTRCWQKTIGETLLAYKDGKRKKMKNVHRNTTLARQPIPTEASKKLWEIA